MKARYSIVILFVFSFFISVNAQLENVFIEKYYISNSSDATDTNGSVVSTNSTTYRIYIDMAKGSKLKKLYSNDQHELMISGDSTFYNHTTEGQSFGRNFNSNRYGEGVTALDSWLTLGQVSLSKLNGKTYFGTPKNQDRNGSMVGGINNDGGSEMISDGLLTNSDPAAGIPLTTFDGLDTMAVLPNSWLENGFDDGFGNDTTIFGSVKKGNVFKSNIALIQNSGVMGVNRDSNQVLIAQLTTKGNIYFSLNVEIEDAEGHTLLYVAKNGADSLLENVFQKAFLNYPIPCGCLDKNYLEYSSSYGCSLPSACKTALVLGCMDNKACNFDANANFSVPSFCCYPGLCANRDISVVCPNLDVEVLNHLAFELYPNPAQDILTVKNIAHQEKIESYSIYDSSGRLLFKKEFENLSADSTLQIDISFLTNGFYTFQLSAENNYSIKKFIKN
jgi:hypothetical protein